MTRNEYEKICEILNRHIKNYYIEYHSMIQVITMNELVEIRKEIEDLIDERK